MLLSSLVKLSILEKCVKEFKGNWVRDKKV